MRFAHTPWTGADTSVVIRGEEYACASGTYWVPPKAERSGRITTSGRELDHAPSKLMYKHVGWIRREDTGKFTAVYRVRLVPFVVLILLVLCAIIGIGHALTNSNAGSTDNGTSASAPSYINSETSAPAKNETKGAVVSYAAYESVADQHWKANALEQSIRLALPGTVISSDGESTENPVDAAPHIYVDLNGDGEFEDSECVYNPMTYGAGGSITDYGKFLKAGTEVNHITLTQAVPAGEYKAELVWTGVLKSDHTPANPMTFDFKITAE